MEVLASTAFVAVAVILCPAATAWEGATLKATLPLGSVLTALLATNLLPSLPEGLE